MRNASSRASRETWSIAGFEEDDRQMSRLGRYHIETIRGKQAWAHILRRSSGARLGKRWKAAASAFGFGSREGRFSVLFEFISVLRDRRDKMVSGGKTERNVNGRKSVFLRETLSL